MNVNMDATDAGNYHVEPEGNLFVYYYSPHYGANSLHEDSVVLLKSTFVSLDTLIRLAGDHKGRRLGRS